MQLAGCGADTPAAAALTPGSATDNSAFKALPLSSSVPTASSLKLWPHVESFICHLEMKGVTQTFFFFQHLPLNTGLLQYCVDVEPSRSDSHSSSNVSDSFQSHFIRILCSVCWASYCWWMNTMSNEIHMNFSRYWHTERALWSSLTTQFLHLMPKHTVCIQSISHVRLISVFLSL